MYWSWTSEETASEIIPKLFEYSFSFLSSRKSVACFFITLIHLLAVNLQIFKHSLDFTYLHLKHLRISLPWTLLCSFQYCISRWKFIYLGHGVELLQTIFHFNGHNKQYFSITIGIGMASFHRQNFTVEIFFTARRIGILEASWF